MAISIAFDSGWTVRIDGKARAFCSTFEKAEESAKRWAERRGEDYTPPDPEHVTEMRSRLAEARRLLRGPQ